MASSAPKYEYSYTENSAPGHLVRLLAESGRTGLVLDVGCGYGALAEPLAAVGLGYAGLDCDPLAIESLRSRGFAAELIDLTTDDLAGRLLALAGGQPVAAITAIDIVEHLSPHQPLVDAIAAAARRLDCLVGFSIPNVTHVDLALKQMIGRWDVTEIGLLDATHISLFDHRRLLASLATAGLEVVAEADMTARFTEQAVPFDHPALRTDSPLGMLLRSLRAAADAHSDAYQFVRLCRPIEPAAAAAPLAEPNPMTPVDVGFTVAVLLPHHAADPAPQWAMLSAQSLAPREVLVVRPPGAGAVAVPLGAAVVEAASDSLADLVTAAIAAATGSHLCMLAPGETVPPGWLAHFGTIAADYGHRVLLHPATANRGGAAVSVTRWEPLQYLGLGGTPAAAFAVPLATIRRLPLWPDAAHGAAAWRGLVARAAAASGVAGGAEGVLAHASVSASEYETQSLFGQFGAEPYLLWSGWYIEAEHLVHRAAYADAIARSRSWRLLRLLRAPLEAVRRLVRR